MRGDHISRRKGVLAKRRVAALQRPQTDERPETAPPLSGYGEAVRRALDALSTGAPFRVLMAMLAVISGGRWSMVIQADLAIDLGMGQGTVSAAIETLVKAEMVERIDHNGTRWYRLAKVWDCSPEDQPKKPRVRKL